MENKTSLHHHHHVASVTLVMRDICMCWEVIEKALSCRKSTSLSLFWVTISAFIAHICKVLFSFFFFHENLEGFHCCLNNFRALFPLVIRFGFFDDSCKFWVVIRNPEISCFYPYDSLFVFLFVVGSHFFLFKKACPAQFTDKFSLFMMSFFIVWCELFFFVKSSTTNYAIEWLDRVYRLKSGQFCLPSSYPWCHFIWFMIFSWSGRR